MSDFVLELEGVSKSYGDFRAVSDVSFAIPPGTVYGFLGPNGAGKTTTIRMILGIVEPTAGRIAIFGQGSALAVRERIGYLPEEKGLYKKMRAWSIIAYFAALKGMGRAAAKRRAYELLERYGLKDFADARTEALSKGMGQKVQVLAAIAHDPELVILDEPFSGLDPVNQEVMEEVIRDFAERGRTVLFSTHVMSHAERMCDRILLIAGGKKVFDDTVAAARRTVPRRMRIESAGDITFLAGQGDVAALVAVDRDGVPVEGVGAEHDAWDVVLTDAGEPVNVVRACLERGVPLDSFDYSPPSLHDVFVHLVGQEAREASFR